MRTKGTSRMTLREFLLSHSLLVEDPYRQAQLRPLEKMKAVDGRLILENGYRVKNEKIFCHICGKKLHFHGITAQLEDGTRILFGRKCAKDYFKTDIWERCWTEYKRKQEIAFAKYRLLKVRISMERTEEWIRRNSELVRAVANSMRQLSTRHPDFYREIEEQVTRNNGRILEISDEGISDVAAAAGLKERFGITEIITSLRSPNGVKTARYIDQHLLVVESFIQMVRDAEQIDSDLLVENMITRFRNNVLPAAEKIDEGLSFAIDLFSEQKLQLVGGWSDRMRIRRLRNKPSVSSRNIAHSVRGIVGSGYELPSFSLVSTLPAITSMSAERQKIG
jgi:hypothetical protein